MIGKPDSDKAPEVLKDQKLADERFARGEAFIASYQATFEALAKQDNAADPVVIRQIELGNEIMDEYGETFSALAKPAD